MCLHKIIKNIKAVYKKQYRYYKAMENTKYMVGLLSLSDTLFCKKDVLGRVFECEINGIKAQIFFPVFPVIDENKSKIGLLNPLLPPQLGKTWKRGNESLDWGEPKSYPDGNSCVKLLALSIECDKESVNENAAKLYESIEKWEHAFLAFLKLVTKQGLDRDRNIGRNTCFLELMDDKYIPNHTPIEISLVIPSDNSFASEEQVRAAISFANSGSDLLLEYQMLLSSYCAVNQNQNRRAIMEACAALEIVLIKQINQLCQKGQLPKSSSIEKMSLGDRIKLVRENVQGLPKKDYDKIVVNPRNDVMHGRNNFPTDDTTNTLIACIEDILSHFHIAYY